MALVEVADGSFVHFLRYLEAAFDVFCLALVTEVAYTAVVLQILEQDFCKVFSMPVSGRLQCTVYLSVTADSGDVTFESVAGMNVLENLVFIDKSCIPVVNDDLEAEVGLLPYQQVNFLSVLVTFRTFVEIMFHLCRGYKPVGLFVEMDVDDIAAAFLHSFLLFTERAEEIFRDAP